MNIELYVTLERIDVACCERLLLHLHAQFEETHLESYDNRFLCRDFEPGTSKLQNQ
jgi:hypothetical protein